MRHKKHWNWPFQNDGHRRKGPRVLSHSRLSLPRQTATLREDRVKGLLSGLMWTNIIRTYQTCMPSSLVLLQLSGAERRSRDWKRWNCTMPRTALASSKRGSKSLCRGHWSQSLKHHYYVFSLIRATGAIYSTGSGASFLYPTL